jgi:hypothetical protein
MYKISGKNDEEDKKLQNEEKLLIFVKSKLQQSI